MDDIVKRLRSLRTEQGDMWPYTNLHEEAADEIERLRKLLAEADIDNIRVNYENERLQKYEKLVRFIASDYWELSHEKIRWLYTEYKTKCRELIKEDSNEQ